MGYRQTYNKYKVAEKHDRTYDGITFASKAEMLRYRDLKLLQGIGEISNFSIQPKFLLQESFTDNKGTKHQAIHYVADFQYTDKFGKIIVEDCKGAITDIYALKKKMFLKLYPEYTFFESHRSQRYEKKF